MTQRKLSLLIVDDSPSILRLVAAMLEASHGDVVDIVALSDSREAAEYLDAHCCDILLSDIEMPGVTGLEILRHAKSRNGWTQVIFMTAHSTWDHLAWAIENGATDYLLKPVKREELSDVVTQCVRRVTRWHRALRGTLKSHA